MRKTLLVPMLLLDAGVLWAAVYILLTANLLFAAGIVSVIATADAIFNVLTAYHLLKNSFSGMKVVFTLGSIAAIGVIGAAFYEIYKNPSTPIWYIAATIVTSFAVAIIASHRATQFGIC